MPLNVAVSIGEIADKMSILEIKSERIQDPGKLENINKELVMLQNSWESSEYSVKDIENEYQALKIINENLWEIEDKIRDKEAENCFDQEFIELARSVYITNDERAAIKKEINLKLGSELTEEKSYSDYQKK